MEPVKSSIRRCAVYTRKSSEKGLEQDFNSPPCQREACEAFIRSQAGEGWRSHQDRHLDKTIPASSSLATGSTTTPFDWQ